MRDVDKKMKTYGGKGALSALGDGRKPDTIYDSHEIFCI